MEDDAKRHTALLAHPFPDLYGSDQMLVQTALALIEADVRVSVVVPEQGALLDVLHNAGIPVTVIPFPVIRKALLSPFPFARLCLSFPRDVFRLVRVLRATDASVLYVNTLTLPHWLIAGWLARVPRLCHVHEAEEGTARLWRLSLTAPLFLATRVVTNSNASLKWIAGSWARLASRCHVIYNGVPMDAPSLYRRTQADKATAAVVGRLSPRKGQDVAIRALAELVSRGHDVRLVLAGTTFRGYGAFREMLQRLAEELGVLDRVEFAGFVSPVAPLFASVDIAIIPSRVEPFGNVAVEAMAAGCPVVASATGGLREIITHGLNGLLVDPDDAIALSDAMERVLTTPTLAADLGKAAVNDVHQRFGVDRYKSEIVHALLSTAS